MNFSFYIKNKLEAEIADLLMPKIYLNTFLKDFKQYGKICVRVFKLNKKAQRNIYFKYDTRRSSGPLVEIKEISQYLKTL